MEPSAAAIFGSYDTVGEGRGEREREREMIIGKDLLLHKFHLVTGCQSNNQL